MPRNRKLYTRTGDDGSTGLFGGERVRKDHPRVEAYGEVDELNAAVGFVIAACGAAGVPGGDSVGSGRELGSLVDILTSIQSRLFDLGADLATPNDSEQRSKIVPISAADVSVAESWIDEVERGNQPLKTFILPGGSEVAARLHVARTICRRAERRVLMLAGAADDSAGVNAEVIRFLNRLSDLFFAMARRANAIEGISDVEWQQRGG